MAGRGLILFAHGSRDPLWRAPMEAVRARILAQHPEARCLCAYLELTTPSLAEAVANLVDQGCSHLTVLPLFLGTGRHARQDLPLMLDQARVDHPGLHIEAAEAVGENPAVIALLAELGAEHLYKPNIF